VREIRILAIAGILVTGPRLEPAESAPSIWLSWPRTTARSMDWPVRRICA